MEREISDKTILDKFAEEFCSVIDKYAVYIVCSGFVSIAHGRPRGTEDIDMIIERISKEKFIKMHKSLVERGFVCVQSDNPEVLYEDYLDDSISIRYVRKDTDFFPPEMEVKFAKDSLDIEQLEERIKLPFTGLDIYFSSIESNIAFKEELLKSNKDIEDARHLRIIYKDKINTNKIKKIKEDIRRIRLYGKG